MESGHQVLAPQGPWVGRPPSLNHHPGFFCFVFQAQLGFLASLPGNMFFSPISAGLEQYGMGLQGGGVGVGGS